MTLNPTRILAINGGSSSIKFAVFELGQTLKRILEGELEKIGSPEAYLHLKGLKTEECLSTKVVALDYTTAVDVTMKWMKEKFQVGDLAAVGHRIVQGGASYYEAQLISPKMLDELRALSLYDSEHLVEEVLLIEAFQKNFSSLSQIACFDTAFHHDLPQVSKLLPIPRRYEAKGIRRYGFHGISYEYLIYELERLVGPKAAQGRIILAHLGNGASLAAVKNGKSLDTSMSFTPCSGICMGTRSGDLDPGMVWYLSQTEKIDAKEFNHMVNFESGLLGISETTSDMRELLKNRTHDFRANEAIEIFCYQIKKWVGAFAAALGGLDILVFAGGIGENVPDVRAGVCDALGFMGIELDKDLNARNESVISTESSDVSVRVIKTDEEWMIAKKVCEVLGIRNQ